ncbi:hypothetical protein CQ018_18775 [Arthrobacter sp. MYb227]|uniref:low temperature requirement protein A n=1 Tax=Arthrobacter sp. MYb227 TaxID=1848601 RepID=UPI000CFE29C1|nr:low temperature requirement protein A [Arthrobacter sp. MYb227]PQZ86720.1 hypothetical protein CQ018_18775 [Arthrobacter sp. MYb227]
MAEAEAAAGDTSAVSAPQRAVDWYELFFDLVFVAVIALSARAIEHEPGVGTVLVFLLLFFPLWWAWVNLMIANNLYGSRFTAVGLLIIFSMPGAAAMAVAISQGVEGHGQLYALGAAWIRLTLLMIWLIPFIKKIVKVPLWRPLAYNLVTAALWLMSLPVPVPWRYGVWALAVSAEVFLLAWRRGFSFDVYERVAIPHLLERIGLFIVIVIGEAVYLVVTGLADHPSLAGAAAGIWGFIICALLARAFFRWGGPSTEEGLAAARLRHSYGAMRDAVMYFPFIAVAALTFIAASLGSAVSLAGEPLPFEGRVLLAVGIGGFYLANALIGLRLGRHLGRVGLLLGAGVLLPAVACLSSGTWPAWATVGLAAIALLIIDALSTALEQRAAAHEK